MFAQNQIHYMLGDTGRSYVVGFGRKYPKQPHHRASSCPAKRNEFVPFLLIFSSALSKVMMTYNLIYMLL